LQNVSGSKLGFLSPLPPQRPTERFDTVIVCGLGKVGYRMVRQLHQLRPRPRIVVVRLDNGRAEFLRRISQLDGVQIVLGDARDPEVLRRAGLDTAYAVAALTADDGLNLQVGLAARRQRPDIHLVLRVFSDALAEKLEDLFGIHTAYSTSGLAGATLAAAAVLGDVSHALTVDQQLFSTDLVTVRAGDHLAGKTVADLRTQYAALVVGLWRAAPQHMPIEVDRVPRESNRRSRESNRSSREPVRAAHLQTLPPLDTVLAAGDEVVLLASLDALARMRASR
jgi:Trk K+ transport system NAD-binding subunit